jgi:hypothetical protein
MVQNKKIKFGDLERQRVVGQLQSSFKTKLTPFIKKKFFSGSNGYFFLIVGGVADWQSIPFEVANFCKEKNVAEKCSIVIVRLLKSRIELYIGQIKPLIDNIHKLSPSEKSQNYTFNIEKVTGELMYLKEIPYYHLTKLWEFPYEVLSEREEYNKLIEDFKNASPELKAEIEKILGKNSDS